MTLVHLIYLDGTSEDLSVPDGFTLPTPSAILLKLSPSVEVNWATVRSARVVVTGMPPPPLPPPVGTGLAAAHPGDVGLETDPAVLFVERFDELNLAALAARWGDSNQVGMSFDATDAPAKTPVGTRSLQIVSPANAGSASHLYKVLNPAVPDTIFVRHYCKFASGSPDHNGIWIGGFNPPSAWPDPQAGSKPNGSDRFMTAVERQASGNLAFYDYWGAMHPDGGGAYWGDKFFPESNMPLPFGVWICVEHQVKLNALTSFDGEQSTWINGVLVQKNALGLKGSWGSVAAGLNPAIFTAQAVSASAFEGFQWRTSAALALNFIWLQNYAGAAAATMKFAQVVVATKYIGPLA